MNVREMAEADVPQVIHYWLRSDRTFLENMGVDVDKLPGEAEFSRMLLEPLTLPLEDRRSYALIWEMEGQAIGHSNLNPLNFGQDATMHLHIWAEAYRRRGLGFEFVKQSLPFYFQNCQITELFCEPYASNAAPNRTLQKLGFEFVRRYETVPGYINFDQEVNRWRLTRAQFDQLMP